MHESERLNVWYEKWLAGCIWQNATGSIEFQYDSQWLTNGGFALSQSLPLQTEAFSSHAGLAHRYFANFLPEGIAREKIVCELKFVNTDFELLRAIGGECAGAISILEAQQQPAEKDAYFRLTQEGLKNLVTSRGDSFSVNTQYHPRLSLAGAQFKCPVLFRNGEYSLPKENSPTSHILKFEFSEFRNISAYETFTTQLANKIGLPTCNVEWKTLSGIPYLLVERYDRQYDDHGRLTRVHQEDFCQALGLGHDAKYEQSGGVSFAACYRLLRSVSSDPATDLRHLLNWQIFNVLAGNSDGHAKNLSLLYLRNGEIRLAPFYDLICTRAIANVDHHLALAIGEKRDPNLVSAKDWKMMAEQCDLNSKFVLRLVNEMTEKLLLCMTPSIEQFESRYDNFAALQRIERIVENQCKRTTLGLKNLK